MSLNVASGIKLWREDGRLARLPQREARGMLP